MNKEQELRPCPFCGGDASIHEFADVPDCGGCHALGPVADTVDDAIAAWNRRSSDEQAEVVAVAWEGIQPDGITSDITRKRAKAEMWEHNGWIVRPLYASPPTVAAGEVTVPSVDEIEAIILATEPDIPASVDGERIWTRRMAKGLHHALTAALAVRDEGIRPDLLAEMAKHPGWSIERGYRDRGDDEGGPYGWCVYDVRGGRSDLEWDLIGFGETPHEALSAAVAALPTPPSRGEGE